MDGINADNSSPLADCNSRSTLTFARQECFWRFEFRLILQHIPTNNTSDFAASRPCTIGRNLGEIHLTAVYYSIPQSVLMFLDLRKVGNLI
jgi:hypothetical protein